MVELRNNVYHTKVSAKAIAVDLSKSFSWYHLSVLFIMELSEALSLIQCPLPQQKMFWADLGCGDGLFTNALSQLLADDSLIYAVDKSNNALKNVNIRKEIQLQKFTLDFVQDALPFKNLSGVLMANALHFVKDKNAFIQKVFNVLNDDGCLIIVEYNTDAANAWVPYPISFSKLASLFKNHARQTQKLNERPSRFGGSMYAAIVTR